MDARIDRKVVLYDVGDGLSVCCGTASTTPNLFVDLSELVCYSVRNGGAFDQNRVLRVIEPAVVRLSAPRITPPLNLIAMLVQVSLEFVMVIHRCAEINFAPFQSCNVYIQRIMGRQHLRCLHSAYVFGGGNGRAAVNPRG